MKLAELQVGSSGTITALSGLSTDVRKKLMVMGILPNTEIKVIRRAPMGDPLQIEVRGVSLAIRNAIAQSIEVESAK
ncbi:iron transporter FeoA [Vibrio sp. 10N.286.49.C2]|uniref:FeoA family protein n=1 Tax=unclassified Vibrio TaxID=2614977 RepID=UPI000C864DBB|nr:MULTISPECIES: FeoA family protein [unclassified Vibrio]PMH38933.1 iron transporter FeoA [Vibrio sp. 10N.286.49.C2]PMH55407.1 iron transporter FeoA [Vibrio sp. 10N.286.49.B1]PMH80868.1 iron transporter FeoA [Vibrio sp. 10N.286.48.B7]